MPIAYMLINTEFGSDIQIIKKLQKIPEFIEIVYTRGAYQIIAKIKSKTIIELNNIITEQIADNNKILATSILLMDDKKT